MFVDIEHRSKNRLCETPVIWQLSLSGCAVRMFCTYKWTVNDGMLLFKRGMYISDSFRYHIVSHSFTCLRVWYSKSDVPYHVTHYKALIIWRRSANANRSLHLYLVYMNLLVYFSCDIQDKKLMHQFIIESPLSVYMPIVYLSSERLSTSCFNFSIRKDRSPNIIFEPTSLYAYMHGSRWL